MTTPDRMESLAAEIATAMSQMEGDRQRLRLSVSAFEAQFGASRVDAWLLTIEGCPSSREAARGHAAAAQAMTRLLQGHPVAARLELFALPWFRNLSGAAPGSDMDDEFARASAVEILRRLARLAEIEAGGHMPAPYLCEAGLSAYRPMVAQLGLSWGRYLDDAFRAAARIDPETFAESWLCLVLQLEDKELSVAVRDALKATCPDRLLNNR
jgi:hypothetical protein